MLSNIDWLYIAGFALDWIIRLAFLLYIPRKRKPSSAIAWLLVIFLIPGIGILLFIIIGTPKLSKRRRDRQARIDKLYEQASKNHADQLQSLNKEQQHKIEPLVNLARSLGKLRALDGNTLKVMPEYNKVIDDIVSEIKKAKEFVHLEYFILALDETTQPLFDAMQAAIKRGVKVRVLFDALGYRAYPRRREMKRLLTEISVEWHLILPLSLRLSKYNRIDLRNHRKILVVDNRVAYIGSQNLIDRSYHRKDDIYYDELVAKLTGPIVIQCAAVFAGDWYQETGEILKITDNSQNPKLPKATGKVVAQLLPSGSAYDTSNNARLFVAMIHAARKSIVITNPYFVPDEQILDAITSAAIRGVKVTIINSESMDQWMVGHAQRSYYSELLSSGINIYLHKAPLLLHSKHITIDDDIAVIGSSNMDIRSFELNLECIVIAYSKSVVNDLKKVQELNLKNSKKVALKTWHKRSLMAKFLDSVARLTSALQ
jgi:cardiolipin synthase